MKIYNTAPYFDDYNDEKRFHQVLFKPGTAVQTRELNQLQTILQHQIKKFGDHIFKHGSIVIPGNSVSDLNTPFCKIKLEYNQTNLQASQFEGMLIEGTLTGNQARVRKAIQNATDITLYINYIRGSGTSANNTFINGEEIYLTDVPSVRAVLLDENATGVGSLAFINQGVYYVNGVFVNVQAQSIVISENTSTPSCHVLLKIVNDVISTDEDSSLYDNANGSDNYAAPGADRAKITLQLTTLPLGSSITDDYIEIMRYNNGVLEEHAKSPKYSELEKSLAKRTYDESGNYLVEGFKYKIREHLKTRFNDGVYPDGDRSKYVLDIEPGYGYVEGLLSESVSNKKVIMDKARTPDHAKSKKVTVQAEYGRYIYVTNIKNLPNFKERESVDIYNSNNPGDATATKIGEVRVVSVDYYLNDPDSNQAIYKLYVHDLNITAPNRFDMAGHIKFGVTGSAVVLHKLSAPSASFDFQVNEILNSNVGGRQGTVVRYVRSTSELFVSKTSSAKEIPHVGDTVVGNSANSPTATITAMESVGGFNLPPIFRIPLKPINNLRDPITGLPDMQYTVWRSVILVTDVNGDANHVLTDGTIVPIEVGTCSVFTDTGVVSRDKLSISGGNQLLISGSTPNKAHYVSFQVNKSSTGSKIKTLTTVTLSNVVPATKISLERADIYRLVQITTISGEDVTERFTLNNGQTDYAYYHGSVNLTSGSLPTENLNITFEYFEHSGNGDYFCVCSYQTLGEDYIVNIPTYRSDSSSTVYELGSCIDFRPRVGANNDFDVPTAQTISPPVVDTFMTTSATYYVARIDILALTKNGRLTVLRGVPSESPKATAVPSDHIGIASMFIPAYTPVVSSILTKSMNNFRYTMSDISKLANRIGNLEYVSLLSITENSVVTSFNVVDPTTGLNRFRTGFLVDSFDNLMLTSDFFNPEFKARIYGNELSSAEDVIESAFALLEDSSHYQVTNGQITLPYSEQTLISQPLSTRVTNLNPFMVLDWEGVMTIDPPFDAWIEVEDLDTIYKTDNKTVNVTNSVSRPCPSYSYDSWDSGTSYSPAPSSPSSPTYADVRPDVVQAVNDYLSGNTSSSGAAHIANIAGYGGTNTSFEGLVAAHYMSTGYAENNPSFMYYT